MSLTLEPLNSAHLAAAAELVSRRCQALRQQVPSLPAVYEAAETWRPLLSQMIQVTSGIAAMNDGQLAGFLGAWQLAAFRGRPTTFSPEWANAAQADGARRILETMYTYLAGRWRDQGYTNHILSVLAHGRHELEIWNGLGFGQMAIDALRDLRPAAGGSPAAEIRRAGPAQLAEVLRLSEALRQHIAGSPIFLQGQARDAGYYEPWLKEPDRAIWLAYLESRAAAFLQQGPANGDVCEVIVDAGTSSIYGAYTVPQARGQDIATHLLNQGVQWAQEQGYQRLAVDFEPMNHWATRFWLRHFQPVVVSMNRRLDPPPRNSSEASEAAAEDM
jgi:GNAT superfamily N-acetyltransferase